MKISQPMEQDLMAYQRIGLLIGGNGAIAAEIHVRVFTIETRLMEGIIMIIILLLQKLIVVV